MQPQCMLPCSHKLVLALHGSLERASSANQWVGSTDAKFDIQVVRQWLVTALLLLSWCICCGAYLDPCS